MALVMVAAIGAAELVAAGRTKTVGFTAYGGEVAAIEELIDSGVFGALNASINFLNPSAN